MGKIIMGHPYGQTPPNIFTDFDWARENESALLAEYGTQSLIIYKGSVLGHGDTYERALKNAQENVDNDDDVITPIHVLLPLPRPSFSSLRRTDDTD